MHLLKAVPRGSRADWKDIFQVKQATLALPPCLLRKQRNGFVPLVFLLVHHDKANRALLACISAQK